MTKNLDVLIVDDEQDIRSLVSEILKSEGFTPFTASNSTEVFDFINHRRVPSAIILDIWLQGSEIDGLGILEIIKKRYPMLPVIVISGHGTIQTAVSAIKSGAYDYIEKPFAQDKLIIVLKRACESFRLKKENIDLKSKIVEQHQIIGSSPAVIKLISEIEKVANTNGRIFITGMHGSGKELVARMIHKKSAYHSSSFVVFSPYGMSGEGVIKELFGNYDENQGNNLNRKLCVLESANNGTLYIDEICDMPPVAQSRLLRFLQDQIIEIDNGKPVKLNIRIVTSTSKDIQQEITKGKFRQDLYYRLNVIPIKVPSLSERKEDIPLLVKHFVKQLAKSTGLRIREFADEAIILLQTYNWPGNIRQLKNLVEWTLIMSPSEVNPIKASFLPQEVIGCVQGIGAVNNKSESFFADIISLPLKKAREEFERRYLMSQLSIFGGNISRTSISVGMERSALHRKLKMLEVSSAGGGKGRSSEENCIT